MTKDKADFLNREAKNTLEFFPQYCENNYPGWALVFIEAEQPIPEAWRGNFYDELTSPDANYRKQLEESINHFGVRFI